MASARPSIVITYPYPIGQKAAGGSRTIREVAIHLTRAGADVVIMPVSTNPLSRAFPRKAPDPSEVGSEYDAELSAASVEVIRPPQSRIAYHLDGLPVRAAVKKLLGQRKVDLVLGHFHEAGFLPRLCAKHGVSFGYLATWQTYAGLAWRPRRFLGWFRRWGWLRKWIEHITIVRPHRLADIHFAISEFTTRELIGVLKVDRRTIRLCPLGVEPSFLEVERTPPAAIRNLIFFGRITPSKGFADAMEALGIVHAQGLTDWTYRLYGSGRPEWARAEAEKHGIADRVEIHEPVDTAGLRQALAASDLAVLPSHAESFGHSFVEAQASGIPVVGYHTGSVPEVVQDGVTGWLAPFPDRTALAGHIARAIRDPKETFEAGRRAQERVRTTYTWERTAQIILDGLAELR